MTASATRINPLTEGPIASTLFFFTLPILGSNVLQSLNGSVNAIWVGHYLGEAALTATSNANTILFFLLSLVFGVGMAAAILIGQSIGARNVDQAKRVVGNGAALFIAGAIVITLTGSLFTEPLLRFMQTPPDAMPFAIAYLRIIFAAVPFLFLYTFVMMVLRGTGDSKTPFWFLLVSVILDIALNPVLIFGVGPVPGMGIAGSALATLISQAVTLVAMLAYLRRRRHLVWLHGSERRFLRPDRGILRSLVTKGLPMGLQMIVIAGSGIVMISLVNAFGSQTTAAFGAAMQLWNYVMMPALAVAMASSAMAAQNIGARRMDRVERVAVTGVGFNVLMTGVLVAVIYAFNRGALGLFLPDDGGSIAIAQHVNAIVLWSFIVLGIAMVLGSVVRATGAAVPPLIVLFLALWVIRIPFAMFFADRWHADAVWWSFPIGAATAAFLMWLYYRYGNWRRAHMLESASRPAHGETVALEKRS